MKSSLGIAPATPDTFSEIESDARSRAPNLIGKRGIVVGYLTHNWTQRTKDVEHENLNA
jgi:hypothetical protein